MPKFEDPKDALALPRTLPLLLAALGMLGPFSIDTYLPSFHAVERSLSATPLEVQQTLTAFLVPFAFMTLWHGSISDAFGRRPVILTSLVIVALTSIGSACAPNIETLWVMRVLQGLASGIFVVGRAVVRDVYEGPAAQRAISQISVLFAIAPAVAPVLGGWLQEWFGWRSVFLFLALFAIALLIWTALSLPETLPVLERQPLHFGALMRSYGHTLTHRRFVAAALAAAFTFTAIFLYIAAASALLLRHLHLRETQFLWLFGPVTAGMMLGGALSGRAAGRLHPRHTVGWACAVMIAASIANVALHALAPARLPWSMVPLFFYAAGMSLGMPTLSLLGLDFFPAHRGLASSCQAFLLTGLNALTAGLLVPFASVSPLRLAITSAALLAVGLVCTHFAGADQPVVAWSAEVPEPA